jgi:hypothetical protein
MGPRGPPCSGGTNSVTMGCSLPGTWSTGAPSKKSEKSCGDAGVRFDWVDVGAAARARRHNHHTLSGAHLDVDGGRHQHEPHAGRTREHGVFHHAKQQVCGDVTLMHLVQHHHVVPIFTRVRVEIMGPVTYENAGKSQSVLLMISPIIFTRTRSSHGGTRVAACMAGVW